MNHKYLGAFKIILYHFSQTAQPNIVLQYQGRAKGEVCEHSGFTLIRTDCKVFVIPSTYPKPYPVIECTAMETNQAAQGIEMGTLGITVKDPKPLCNDPGML